MRAAILGLVLVGIAVNAVQGSDEPKGDDIPAVTEEQAKGIGKVTSMLGEDFRVDIVRTPLKQVCADIAKATRLEIHFDQTALKKADIDNSALVTFKMRDVPMRECLSNMLKPLGLTYRIRPDGLLITPLPEKGAP